MKAHLEPEYIGDWVPCKRGSDSDNSNLKFLFDFRKIFQLPFIQLFSADAKISFLNCQKKILPSKT